MLSHAVAAMPLRSFFPLFGLLHLLWSHCLYTVDTIKCSPMRNEITMVIIRFFDALTYVIHVWPRKPPYGCEVP